MIVTKGAATPSPYFPDRLEPLRRDQTIQEIVLPTLQELGISLAIGAICSFFVTSGGAAILVLGIAVQTIVNLSIRILLSHYEHKDAPVPKLLNWLKALYFSVGSLHNGMILVHETGHALAVKALLKNPNPTISLSPYTSGLTTFSVRSPTPLGLRVGKENIMPLVSAAGPALSLALSSVALASGLACQEAAPEMSRMLIVAALVDFVNHAIYALTALVANPTKLTHDFVSLWAAGIHPITSAVTIVAIPAIIYTIFYFS